MLAQVSLTKKRIGKSSQNKVFSLYILRQHACARGAIIYNTLDKVVKGSVHASDGFPKKSLDRGVGGVSCIQFLIGFLEFV